MSYAINSDKISKERKKAMIEIAQGVTGGVRRI